MTTETSRHLRIPADQARLAEVGALVRDVAADDIKIVAIRRSPVNP